MSDYQMYLAHGGAGDLHVDDDDVNAEDKDREDSANWTGQRKGGMKEEDEEENEYWRMGWKIK